MLLSLPSGARQGSIDESSAMATTGGKPERGGCVLLFVGDGEDDVVVFVVIHAEHVILGQVTCQTSVHLVASNVD